MSSRCFCKATDPRACWAIEHPDALLRMDQNPRCVCRCHEPVPASDPSHSPNRAAQSPDAAPPGAQNLHPPNPRDYFKLAETEIVRLNEVQLELLRAMQAALRLTEFLLAYDSACLADSSIDRIETVRDLCQSAIAKADG